MNPWLLPSCVTRNDISPVRKGRWWGRFSSMGAWFDVSSTPHMKPEDDTVCNSRAGSAHRSIRLTLASQSANSSLYGLRISHQCRHAPDWNCQYKEQSFPIIQNRDSTWTWHPMPDCLNSNLFLMSAICNSLWYSGILGKIWQLKIRIWVLFEIADELHFAFNLHPVAIYSHRLPGSVMSVVIFTFNTSHSLTVACTSLTGWA